MSPSLLALAVDVNQTVSENPQFDLGMGECLDSENLAKKANEAPPPKRMRLNLLRGNPLLVDLKTLCLPSSYRNFLRDVCLKTRRKALSGPCLLTRELSVVMSESHTDVDADFSSTQCGCVVHINRTVPLVWICSALLNQFTIKQTLGMHLCSVDTSTTDAFIDALSSGSVFLLLLIYLYVYTCIFHITVFLLP